VDISSKTGILVKSKIRDMRAPPWATYSTKEGTLDL